MSTPVSISLHLALKEGSDDFGADPQVLADLPAVARGHLRSRGAWFPIKKNSVDTNGKRGYS